MYYICGKSVGNFETRVSLFLEDRHQAPMKIGVIYNVSKKRVLKEGVESWDVEIRRNFGDHSYHFATVILNKATKEIVYGDSRGWSPAEMVQFYSAICKEKMPKIKSIECLESTANAHGHECVSTCSLNYPLQKDRNICGVVAIFMLAFASLLPEYFQFIANNKRGLNRGLPKLFFADATRYGKYLRQVLMAWFSETRVSMKYLAPTDILNGINISEDDNPKQAVNMKETSIKVVEMVAGENVVKSNERCQKEPKSPHVDQNNIAEATKKSKEAKVNMCKISSSSTSRGFNLRHHFFIIN